MKAKALSFPAKTAIVLALVTVIGISAASAAAAVNKADLTDEQLQTLEQVRELHQSGDYEAARALAQEAGLPIKHKANKQEREAVKAALEANDYDLFVELTAEAPFADDITPEIFAILVDAHSLRVDGNHEVARELLEDAGIERPILGKRHRMRHYFANQDLTDEQREVLQEARELRREGVDRETVRQMILNAGIELPSRGQ